MNEIFQTLLREKTEIFRYSFLHASRQAFIDPTSGGLRHPGEFGSYREQIVRGFLSLGVPSSFEIGTGFLLNSSGGVSTQLDVVIFDPHAMPRIESAEQQRFYFVEGVAAIGEVKSRLTKPQLREALNKLARAKVLTEVLSSQRVIRRAANINTGKFDRQVIPLDQVVSFLICESFDFDASTLPTSLSSMYDLDIPFRCRHNLLMSVNDGVALYFDPVAERQIFYPFVIGKRRGKNIFLKGRTDPLTHIEYFASSLFNLLSIAPILHVEMPAYMHSRNELLDALIEL